MKKFIFLTAFALVQLSLSAQIRNVRADSSGPSNNVALWCDVVLNVFGEDSISCWLKRGNTFSILYYVDDSGNLISIDRIRGNRKPTIDENSVRMMIDYAHNNGILFPMCYEPYGIIDDMFIKQPDSDSIHFQSIGGLPVIGLGRDLSLRNKSEIERLKAFIKCNITPTIRELLVRDRCLIYLDDGRIVSVDGCYSADALSDSLPSVHYDTYLFCAYDELSADIPSGNRTVNSYIFDHVLYLMERGMNPFCVDHDYFKVHMFDPGSILSRYNLKNDGTESNVRMMEILSGLYTEKYGRTDYFNQQCLKRIAEMSQYIPDSRP